MFFFFFLNIWYTDDDVECSKDKIHLTRLRTQVKVAMKTDFYFEWLPSHSLAWYKKEIKKLDKDTKVSTTTTPPRIKIVAYFIIIPISVFRAIIILNLNNRRERLWDLAIYSRDTLEVSGKQSFFARRTSRGHN